LFLYFDHALSTGLFTVRPRKVSALQPGTTKKHLTAPEEKAENKGLANNTTAVFPNRVFVSFFNLNFA